MKKTGVKKLELKRLTIKQLGTANGGAWHLLSGGSQCSNTCSTCDPGNTACWGWQDDPTDNCGSCSGGDQLDQQLV